MAKQLGYIGKNETLQEQRERVRRSQEMGKQLHLQHLQRVKNAQLELELRNKKEEEERILSEMKGSLPGQDSGAKPFEFLKSSGEEGSGPEASDGNFDNPNG
jgi:hypothetical protein